MNAERVWTVVDLFAGAGGTALGFHQTGRFRIVAAVEVDKDAARTYERNFGVQVTTANINELDPSAFRRSLELRPGELDVLVGCPPCQGFTRMRNDARAGDERNRLVFRYLDFVEEFRPKFVVFENVPGLVNTRHGKSFYNALLTGVERLGYAVRAEEVDAADYGVPQRRKRIIILGAPSEKLLPLLRTKRTHGNPLAPETLYGFVRPWRTVRWAIANLPPLEAGEVCSTDKLHRAHRMGDRVADFIRRVPKDGGSRTDVPQEYWLPCHKKHKGHGDAYGRLAWERPAVTVTCGCSHLSKGRFVHPEQDRGITPREAALLQGFPKTFAFEGTQTSVCRQIGNAVPPPLAYAIAMAVHEQLVRMSVEAEKEEEGWWKE